MVLLLALHLLILECVMCVFECECAQNSSELLILKLYCTHSHAQHFTINYSDLETTYVFRLSFSGIISLFYWLFRVVVKLWTCQRSILFLLKTQRNQKKKIERVSYILWWFFFLCSNQKLFLFLFYDSLRDFFNLVLFCTSEQFLLFYFLFLTLCLSTSDKYHIVFSCFGNFKLLTLEIVGRSFK